MKIPRIQAYDFSKVPAKEALEIFDTICKEEVSNGIRRSAQLISTKNRKI